MDDTPVQSVRIRLLKPVFENDEVELDETGEQCFYCEVIEGGLVPEMVCISELHSDEWEVFVPFQMDGERAGYLLNEICLYPSAKQQPPIRILQEGEIMQSVQAYPVDEFLREATDNEYDEEVGERVEEPNLKRPKSEWDFSYEAENPSGPAHIEILERANEGEMELFPCKFRLLSGSMRKRLILRSDFNGDQWEVTGWFMIEANYYIILNALGTARVIQEGETFTEVGSY